MAMKRLILCYKLVIILVLVRGSRKHCVFQGSNRNVPHCDEVWKRSPAASLSYQKIRRESPAEKNVEHFGVKKMLEKFRERLYWVNCKEYVKEWPRKCEVCETGNGPLGKIKPCEEPYIVVKRIIDIVYLIRKLPKGKPIIMHVKRLAPYIGNNANYQEPTRM
ncbi:hypothetical protein CBL_04850 [Carabus blaptoides fortunei]